MYKRQGRVQSVAVRIIVDREEEIRKFKPEEYWSIDAKLLAKSSRKAFAAKLYGKDKKISIKTKEEADAILKELEGCDYVVELSLIHIFSGCRRCFLRCGPAIGTAAARSYKRSLSVGWERCAALRTMY